MSKNERERDFRHDERVAHPALAFAAAAGARAGFQRAVEIDVRRLPGRDESEDDARGERDEQGETEDGGIELNRR